MDPVVAVVAAVAGAAGLVFGVLERPWCVEALGGGVTGRLRVKWLGAFTWISAAGLAALASGIGPTGWGLGGTPLRSVAWASLGIAVAVPVVAFAARAGLVEPEVGERSARTVLSWAVYLFGYELMFRGLLTVQLCEALGVLRGLAVMTGLYVLAHLTKEPAEIAITAVAGPLFGWMALDAGGMWPVLAIHVAVAATSELASAPREAGA